MTGHILIAKLYEKEKMNLMIINQDMIEVYKIKDDIIYTDGMEVNFDQVTKIDNNYKLTGKLRLLRVFYNVENKTIFYQVEDLKSAKKHIEGDKIRIAYILV